MKAIKFIFGTLAVAGLLSFSQSVYAQEDGNRDENGKIVRGPYETNKFWDNWFVTAGAGFNSVVSKVVDFSLGGLALELNAGKWITPGLGLRGGYSGLKNSFDCADGYATSYDPDFYVHYFHIDALWNATNTIWGYKQTRFWNVSPYMSAGMASFYDHSDDLEYLMGPGVLNQFRLGDHFAIALDLRWLIGRGEDLHLTTGNIPRFVSFPSATLGLTYNFGKTNFDRHSSVTPVVIPVPFTTEQYNSLQDRVAELEKENAALKDELATLKAQGPDTVYVKVSEVEPVAKTFFNINSSVISVREKAHLDFFVEKVIKNTSKTYTITGSADKATGSVSTNERLALARANAVKDYLVKKCGVDADRLVVKSVGGVADYKINSLNRAVVIE